MEDSEAQETNVPYTILDYTADTLEIKANQVEKLYNSCTEEERKFIQNYLIFEDEDQKPQVEAIINKYLKE